MDTKLAYMKVFFPLSINSQPLPCSLLAQKGNCTTLDRLREVGIHVPIDSKLHVEDLPTLTDLR